MCSNAPNPSHINVFTALYSVFNSGQWSHNIHITRNFCHIYFINALSVGYFSIFSLIDTSFWLSVLSSFYRLFWPRSTHCHVSFLNEKNMDDGLLITTSVIFSPSYFHQQYVLLKEFHCYFYSDIHSPTPASLGRKRPSD